MITKKDIVQKIIGQPGRLPVDHQGRAFACANIALCKYWGKRNEELNLPLTDSLSISLGRLGAHTIIKPADTDSLQLNNRPLLPADPMTRRLFDFLDLFRPDRDFGFNVISDSSIPVGAGLASSASGFAALVLALDDLFMWDLDLRSLSILARMGSGSAARSLHTGFVQWHAGQQQDGMDCFAEHLEAQWPALRLGLLMLSNAPKKEGSRTAMKRTRETSVLYRAWPQKVETDIRLLREAITTKDFNAMGITAESNALAMHATMMDSRPPILYWLPESVAAMQQVWSAREDGLPVYFTMDAGPNLKLLFLEEYAEQVRGCFPHMVPVDPFETL
jgi:diphosphomevalonate decarboxylase